MDSVNKNSKTLPKLTNFQMFGYGSGDFAQNLIYNTVSTYLLFFYTNVYGLNPAAAATMFLVVRVIDAINDPIVGTIIDKHSTKFGKYRPWLLYFGLPFTVLSIMCFWTPSLGYMGKLIYAYTTYVGLSMLYTVVNISYGSLNAAMTRDNDEIVKMSSYRMFLSQLGALVVSYGVPIIVKLFSNGTYTGAGARNGWFFTMLIFSLVGELILLFCFSQTKERIFMPASTQKEVHVKDLYHQLKVNKPLRILAIFFVIKFGLTSVANSVGAYFISYNVGQPDLLPMYSLLPALPAFVLVPLTPWMRKKIGKKPLLQGSMVVAIIGFSLMYIVPSHNVVAVFIARIIANCGVIEASTFAWSFVPETITYGEWKTGKRENGIANAIVGFFFKFGMALGGVIPGYILALFAFNADLKVQSAKALQGIMLTATIIPIVFLIAGIICFSFYKLSDNFVNKMNKEIEQRAD